jgi:O-antigen/teichoic acid export membrane protein
LGDRNLSGNVEKMEIPPTPAAAFTEMTATLAGGAGLSLAGKFAGRLLGFLGDIAAARILGPVIFGLYAIGWTVLRTLTLVTPLGLDRGVIFFAAPHWKKDDPLVRRIIDRSAWMALISGSVLGGLFFLAAPFLAANIFQKPDLTYIFRWFSLSFPLSSVLAVIISATKITLNMQYSVWIQDVGQPAAGLFFLFLFYLLGQRLLGVLASDVASFAAALLLAVLVLRRLFPQSMDRREPHPYHAKTLLAFSIPTALAGVFSPFLIWADRLFVGLFRSASETGVYQAVSQTSVIFSIILVAFSAIVTPMITPLHKKKQIRLLEELYRVSTKWGLYFSLPIFGWLCIYSREILSALFGPSYAWGWPALVVLATGQLVNVGTGTVGPMLTMTGHQKQWLAISGIALLLNLCLNGFLVPRWGMMGAALGTASSLTFLFVVGVCQIRKSVGIWPYDRRFVKGAVAGIFSGAIYWILHAAYPLENLPGLVFVLFAGIAVFLLGVLALGFDREDVDALQNLLAGRKFPARIKGLQVPDGPKN